MLPDVWEGMAGIYLGKDYSILPFLFDVYNVEDRRSVMDFIAYIGSVDKQLHNEELSRKRKKK